MSNRDLWPLIHTERAALAESLSDLPDDAWNTPSLCDRWTVEDVLAHLTAAARTSTVPWLANMVASRFDTDRHNRRLLEKHRGATPAETLATFRRASTTTVAPLGSQQGALGEVVVHSQDIARPLGLTLLPSREAVEAVAAFFARTDFAVNSRTLTKGLRLESNDGQLRTGDGPMVTGNSLALVLAMAGRPSALDELSGEGVAILRERLADA
ncbi:maleylpyruvate isomerase family mycothiol-dependent enzyme [Brachybacterium sp. GCM10030268]|uniref:maleylpyruvate isomerase family mycothiol-dependent enzyme n=1 Tax=Brachybacterium sp. GCM10030268 TaxID=3273382 RepID=UPI003616A4E3